MTYTPGDLIIFKISDQTFYGEVLGIAEEGLEVSRLKKTKKQNSRIWEFVDDDKWSVIDTKYVQRHIKIPTGADRAVVVEGWKSLGFVAGGDGITFCKVEDEDVTTLPIYQGREDMSDDEDPDGYVPSSNPNMRGYASDGFVVPDDEGSDFEFADPSELDAEAAKFVRETHQAVHDFDQWEPEDKQGKAIKKYIQAMDYKATIETDNKRVENGKEAISTSKPPIDPKPPRKKRRKT